MPTKKYNAAKVKIWTGTMTAEIDGTIAGAVINSFSYIMPGREGMTAAKVREYALQQMQAQHEKLKEAGL